MRSEDEQLRACPTCGTAIGDLDLGLRDFSTWLDLPGRVGGSDIDCIIEQSHTGRALALEFKPSKWVPKGQALLFDRLCAAGFDVWIVAEMQPMQMCIWRPETLRQVWDVIDPDELTQAVSAWWALGED
jgi:hypothetical protein